jgi:glycosyltransferase involved in cell wall biosynthesis
MQKLSAFFSAERWDELSARVRVMPMGIDPECLPSPADALGREPRTLLFLGRLSEKKGVSDLLDAAATLSREYPGFRLLIAGAGPLESGLREHVRILEMEEVVEFLGFVDESGKKECFARASIQVAPSIKTSDGDEEGLPVAILEGLAAGLIVVATDESGACDVIEQGKSGFIVPARSPESISETVRRIFHLTELERNQVSENARRAGLEFVWEKQAKRLFGFLFSRRSQ